jgi:hypothetical protein
MKEVKAVRFNEPENGGERPQLTLFAGFCGTRISTPNPKEWGG